MGDAKISRLVDRPLSRRRFLQGTGAGVAALALGGPPFLARAARAQAGSHGHPLPPGHLHTNGGHIVSAAGTTVKLAGVNWYGFECSSMVAGGLDHQSVDTICQTIVSLGFNTVRLPFSEQMVLQNPKISNYLTANPGLKGQRALQIMDAVINSAGSHGLKVILDNHRSEAGWSTESNGLWYTYSYPESTWISTWQQVVRRYQNNPAVIGCDLRNEPGDPAPNSSAWPANGGSLWGYDDPNNQTGYPNDWTRAATKAGNAILATNPNLLIFVEGVRWDPAGPLSNHGNYWFGGNLMGVGNTPAFSYRPAPVRITLNVPNQLVYSVHDYGPDMYSALPWCNFSNGSANSNTECFNTWDQVWGYIFQRGIAPVYVYEFGTENGYKPQDTTPKQYYTDVNSVNAQGCWFTYLVQYLQLNNLSWCYWCLNGTQSWCSNTNRDPSQPDWYGVLDPMWKGIASQPMMNKLASIQ